MGQRLAVVPFRSNHAQGKAQPVPAGFPAAAAVMLVQAQAAVNEKYRIYEDLATRDGSRFLPHWESAFMS